MPVVADNSMVRADGDRHPSGMALPAGAPQQASRPVTVPRVYIERQVNSPNTSNDYEPQPTIKVSSWYWGIDGADCYAELSASLSTEDLQAAGVIDTQDKHFAHYLDMLTPDRRVRIGIPNGSDAPIWLFEGRVEEASMASTPKQQRVTARVISEPQWHMRHAIQSQIIGRYMPRNAYALNAAVIADESVIRPMLVETLPCVFNARGLPNRSPHRQVHPARLGVTDKVGILWTQVLHLFHEDDASNAEKWNAATALRYLVGLYAQQINSVSETLLDVSDFFADTEHTYDDSFVPLPPNATHGDPFLRALLEEVTESCTSISVEQALKLICGKAGLHFAYQLVPEMDGGAVTGGITHRLILWAAVENGEQQNATQDRVREGKARMGAPLAHDIPRDAPFSNYLGQSVADFWEKNAAQDLQLEIDHRCAASLHLLAGPEWWEVTLLLRPGWYPHKYLDFITTKEQLEEALDFWEDELGAGEDNVDDDGQPISKYHARHKDHWQLDDVSRYPGGKASRYGEVGRLWIFPDTSEYLNAALNGSDYARSVGPWSGPGVPWHWYSPWIEGGSERSALAYGFPGTLAGVPQSVTQEWAIRRRPFEPLLSFEGASIKSRAPIVRFNFAADTPNGALADTRWVAGRADDHFDKTQAAKAALLIRTENLLNDTTLWLNPTDGYQESSSILTCLMGEPLEAEGPIKPHFFVSVTCAVRADGRTKGFASMANLNRPDPNVTVNAHRVLDSGMDRWLNYFRTGSANIGERGEPILRADGLLGEVVERKAQEFLAQIARKMVAGSLEYPWLATDIRPGDSFSGCSQLGIEFATWPQVIGIQYFSDENAGVRTKFVLSDTRDEPEVQT